MIRAEKFDLIVDGYSNGDYRYAIPVKGDKYVILEAAINA